MPTAAGWSWCCAGAGPRSSAYGCSRSPAARGARERETQVIGLGPARDVSIALARELAGRCRAALAAGEDPQAPALGRDRAGGVTFGELADEVLAALPITPRNKARRALWARTLGDAYCRSLRRLPIDGSRQPTWSPCSSRIGQPSRRRRRALRSRIERVLDRATVARPARRRQPGASGAGTLRNLLRPSRRHFSAAITRPCRGADVPGVPCASSEELNSVSAARPSVR